MLRSRRTESCGRPRDSNAWDVTPTVGRRACGVRRGEDHLARLYPGPVIDFIERHQAANRGGAQ